MFDNQNDLNNDTIDFDQIYAHVKPGGNNNDSVIGNQQDLVFKDLNNTETTSDEFRGENYGSFLDEDLLLGNDQNQLNLNNDSSLKTSLPNQPVNIQKSNDLSSGPTLNEERVTLDQLSTVNKAPISDNILLEDEDLEENVLMLNIDDNDKNLIIVPDADSQTVSASSNDSNIHTSTVFDPLTQDIIEVEEKNDSLITLAPINSEPVTVAGSVESIDASKEGNKDLGKALILDVNPPNFLDADMNINLPENKVSWEIKEEPKLIMDDFLPKPNAGIPDYFADETQNIESYIEQTKNNTKGEYLSDETKKEESLNDFLSLDSDNLKVAEKLNNEEFLSVENTGKNNTDQEIEENTKEEPNFSQEPILDGALKNLNQNTNAATEANNDDNQNYRGVNFDPNAIDFHFASVDSDKDGRPSGTSFKKQIIDDDKNTEVGNNELILEAVVPQTPTMAPPVLNEGFKDFAVEIPLPNQNVLGSEEENIAAEIGEDKVAIEVPSPAVLNNTNIAASLQEDSLPQISAGGAVLPSLGGDGTQSMRQENGEPSQFPPPPLPPLGQTASTSHENNMAALGIADNSFNPRHLDFSEDANNIILPSEAVDVKKIIRNLILAAILILFSGTLIYVSIKIFSQIKGVK